MRLYEEGVKGHHYIDANSGALIFPRSRTDILIEENKNLKVLLAALIEALPQEITNKIPKEVLDVNR
jgi:hypothetical protein